MAQETVTCTCVPYEWDWSQDVEKYALDLVLSFFTHTNTVQAIAVASTGARFSYRTPYQLADETYVPSSVFERLARYLVDGALERPSELRST